MKFEPSLSLFRFLEVAEAGLALTAGATGVTKLSDCLVVSMTTLNLYSCCHQESRT